MSILVDGVSDWLSRFSKWNDLEKQRLYIAQRTEGTGKWLLKAKKYRAWKKSVHGVLWLDGIRTSPLNFRN